MAASRLVSKFMKAKEAGTETASIEEMISVIFDGCLDDSTFYDLPVDAICRIVLKRGEALSMDDAGKLITKLMID